MSVILLYITFQIYIILLPEKIILPDILPSLTVRLILVSVHASSFCSVKPDAEEQG